MAIEIKETFQVEAPLNRVWDFLMDPRQVVACMPGAELEEVIDGRTFVGSVRVKIGAITTAYKGRVRFAEVDEGRHTMQIVAEGRETGGGTAKGSMSSQLRSLGEGKTEIVAEASVDLTGRVVQVGRGMIQGVAQQLFKQFVVAARRSLEQPEADVAELTAGAPSQEPIRAFALVVQLLWATVAGLFRRLLGRR